MGVCSLTTVMLNPEKYSVDKVFCYYRQHFPSTDDETPAQGAIHRRDILGGIVHDYYRDAA